VQELAGIQPLEEAPGYRRFRIAPKPNWRLRHVKARFASPAGTIVSSWALDKHGNLAMEYVVPFDAEAELILPDARAEAIRYEGPQDLTGIVQERGGCRIRLRTGTHRFRYTPSVPYVPRFNSYSDLRDLLANEQVAAIVRRHIPDIDLKKAVIYGMKLASMREMQFVTRITDSQLDALDHELEQYEFTI